jgi:polyprenyl-phospho-N-acetylgalactosaminyl synthase
LKVFVIVPAYNESDEISRVLHSLLLLNYQVILVDDGSTDNTAQIASAFPVLLIRHGINLGQGAALETGMEAARIMGADYVVHFDADGQHDPADIARLLAPLQNDETDLVFGSRFLESKTDGIPKGKKMVLRSGRWINYFLTGILLSDAHNGFRALNKKALSAIHFHQSGMAHASEILFETRKNALRYKEVPVHVQYTDYSRQKGQGLLNSINIIFHLLFNRK